jgi:putative ABC transport system permease protein
MSILGSSASASTERVIKSAMPSQLVISDAVGVPFSPAIADEVRQVDGVETVAEFRQANAKLDGKSIFVGAADPEELAKVLNVQLLGGQDLKPGTVLVDDRAAEDAGLKAGDTASIVFQNDKPLKVTVAGTYLANSLPASYIVSLETMERGGLKPLDSLVFITTEDGADVSQVRDRIDSILESNPTVTLKDPQEFVDEQLALIDQFLAIIYALLGLAIVIAVLGIINTLALSVIERTREIGLLRAVGLSRRQLRRMVRLESVAIALLGAVLGIAMGLAFGIALQRAIADEGLDVLSIPWVTLVVFVVLSAIVGILAAVLPARRAAKLNVLQAINTE